MRNLIDSSVIVGCLYILYLSFFTYTPPMWAVDAESAAGASWQVGTPIATYWAGPSLTNAVSQQMVEGGFNLVWCGSEKELDVAGRHGLRGLLTNGLLRPESLDDSTKEQGHTEIIELLRKHAAKE